MSVKSRVTAIQIIGQRRTFYRQRISESSCAKKKKNVDIDILVTSWNGDRKMQSIRRTGRPLTRIGKWNQLSQSR